MESQEKVDPSRGEWVPPNESRASAAFPGVSYAEQIQSAKRRLEMCLENKTSRSYQCPISTHLVGSSRRLCIRFVEAEDAEPAYALKLYRVEDQQIRSRDKHNSKDSLSTISNCALTLEALEARLLGVAGARLMAECRYKEYEEDEKEMRQTEQRWLGCSDAPMLPMNACQEMNTCLRCASVPELPFV